MQPIFRRLCAICDNGTVRGPQVIVVCLLVGIIAFGTGLHVNRTALEASQARLRAAVAEVNEANRRIDRLNHGRAAALAEGGSTKAPASVRTAAVLTTKPEEEWSAPGTELLTMHDGRDNVTQISIPVRAMCTHMSALARQQESDCIMARLAGVPYIAYVLDDGDDATQGDEYAPPSPPSQPPARSRAALLAAAR